MIQKYCMKETKGCFLLLSTPSLTPSPFIMVDDHTFFKYAITYKADEISFNLRVNQLLWMHEEKSIDSISGILMYS